ncbi:MAG: hypothetical protein AAFY82_10540 [Pseudomonadota bacterium]
MTFILIGNKPEKDDLQLANRAWRPIAAEIARSKLIDGERCETIAFHLCTKVDALEAKRISDHLRQMLKSGELPTSIDPDAAHLVVDFAGSSDGFEVC